MKYYLSLCLVLIPGALRSEVFKCEAADGSISYQQQKCSVSTNQSTIKFENIDQERVKLAQQKLKQALEERAHLEAQRDEQDRQKRELELKTQRALYEQQMINETKLQTQAIQENTEVLEKRLYSNRVYYGGTYKPVVRPPTTKPVAKPQTEIKSIPSGISINIK